MQKELMLVQQNKEIANNIFEMKLIGNLAKFALPGQFINIAINNESMLLRRPISVCEVDGNILTIVYKILGEGTKILSTTKENTFLDILGPLGNGFTLHENKKVLLIGGGIGVPPLIELAKRLRTCKITFVVGYRNKEEIYYQKQLENLGLVYYATDDGSYGFKGNVLELIKEKELDFDLFYSCGPTGMLRALDNEYYLKKTGYLSFESRMACGFGACTGCVCESRQLKDKALRVCKEGPVFGLGEIKYD